MFGSGWEAQTSAGMSGNSDEWIPSSSSKQIIWIQKHVDVRKKKKKERGPETVVNISKRAAGLQPFITRSGHFAYKHPDTSSNILEVKWVPPPPPSQVTKLYTHPATRTLGYYQTPGGGEDPRIFYTLGYHLASPHWQPSP